MPTLAATATSVGVFSPDNEYLVVNYADARTRVWNWSARKIALEKSTFLGCAFTPDSKSIAVTDATNISLFSLKTGQVQRTLPLPGFTSTTAPGWFRFDPSGQRLAVFTTEQHTNVFVIDSQTGEVFKTLSRDARVLFVAWHPKGRYLATGDADTMIRIWDTVSGNQIGSWKTKAVISMAFNNQGDSLASADYNGHLYFWDFETGRKLNAIEAPGGPFGFSPDDSQITTGHFEGTGWALFESADTTGLKTLYQVPESSNGAGGFVALDEDNNFLACRNQKGIGLWNFKTGNHIGTVGPANVGVTGFTAKGKELLFTTPTGLFRWRTPTPTWSEMPNPELIGGELIYDAENLSGICSADGSICCVIVSNRCQVFRTDKFELQAVTGPQADMRFLALSPDKSQLASGSWFFRGVKVWNAHTGALVKELPSETTGARVAFRPTAEELVIGSGEACSFWDVRSWTLVRQLTQPTGSNSPIMAFSQDGKLFAGTCYWKHIRLFNAGTGELLAELTAPDSGEVTGLCFAQDSNRLVACESENALRVWDLREIRQRLRELNLDWEKPL